MSRKISVDLRDDGVHLMWTDPHKSGDAADRRHEIVLKLARADVLRDGAPKVDPSLEIRIRAFAATLVVEGNPKKIQKKREKVFAAGDVVEQDGDLGPSYEAAFGAVRAAFEDQRSKELRMARSDLRHAVVRAHELLPYEEVEAIIRNALAEHVMSS